MKKQIVVTAYTIPMGLKCVNRREVPGYLLENGLVLMDSERDKESRGRDGRHVPQHRAYLRACIR